MKLWIFIIGCIDYSNGQFYEKYRKWTKTSQFEPCNEKSETCILSDECDYAIEPYDRDFGAKIPDFNIKSLTQHCADKFIQDALMYRFLLFPGQNSLTWQDEINFTEKLGEGQAFPETTSANRKVHFQLSLSQHSRLRQNPFNFIDFSFI